MSSLHYSSIHEITAFLRSKKISPAELLESQLARIYTLQPKLNAFVHIDADAARASAPGLSRKIPADPLHGIPLTI